MEFMTMRSWSVYMPRFGRKIPMSIVIVIFEGCMNASASMRRSVRRMGEHDLKDEVESARYELARPSTTFIVNYIARSSYRWFVNRWSRNIHTIPGSCLL